MSICGPGRRMEDGFSLLEVMIALAVLAIAMIGTLSVLLVVHQHNTATDEASLATKACQEMMEQLLNMTYDTMLVQDGIAFVAPKLHATQAIGTLQVTEPVPDRAEMRVRIQTQPGQITRSPVNVELINWRSRK